MGKKFLKAVCRQVEERYKAEDADLGWMVEGQGMESGLYPEGLGKSFNVFKQGRIGSNSCSGYRISPLTFNQGEYL